MPPAPQTAEFHFETLDFLVLGGYFLGLILIAFLGAGRRRSTVDYFLAGRNVGWFALGAAMLVANLGSEHFIGLAGSGYETGFAIGAYEMNASVFLLMLGWVVAPFFLRNLVFTVPEFIEQRFGSRLRWILSILSILAYIMTKVSVALLAGGILLHELLGWDRYTSALVMVLITGVYTVAGGLKVVIRTGVYQFFILMGGALLVTIIGLIDIGGIEGLKAAAPAGHLQMLKPASDKDFPWTSLIFGSFIPGFWYWCCDHYMVHRLLAAKDVRNARSGAIFAGYLKILPLFLLVLPGVIAAIKYPGLANANMAFPTLVTDLLPVGLRAVVIASLLAALMSTLAAAFNSGSALFTLDIYQKLYPQASEFMLVNVGRFATFAIVIFSILWVPFVNAISDDLFLYVQTIQSYIAAPVVAVMILALFWSRANGKGAFAAVVTGLLIVGYRLIVADIMNLGDPTDANYTGEGFHYFIARINFGNFTLFLFSICLIVGTIASLMTPAPPLSRQLGLTWIYRKEGAMASYALDEPNSRWRSWNIALSVLLLVLVGIIWVTFA